VNSTLVGLPLTQIQPVSSYISDSPESLASGFAGGLEEQLVAPQDAWHTFNPDIPEFWALPGSGAGSSALLSGAIQQPSGGLAGAKAQAQLRAEAPAFIPGAADGMGEEAFGSSRHV